MSIREHVLLRAMEQLLDDMGPNGLCVCPLVKAQARIAYQAYMDPQDGEPEEMIPLVEAKRIIEIVARAR